MSRRAIAFLAIALALIAVLAVPAAGIAASGGGGLAPSGSSNSTNAGSSSPAAQSQPGNTTVSASGNGMTIVTAASAFLSNQVRFTGSVPRADSGDTIEIQRNGHETGWQWASTAQATVASDGSFSVLWRANHIGRFAIRAVIAGSAPRGAPASPTLTVTVYRSSLATIYGPGFLGPQDGLRPGVAQDHGGSGQPDAEVRDAGGDLLARPHDHGAGDRPRALRPRSRLGPHDGHGQGAPDQRHDFDRRRLTPVPRLIGPGWPALRDPG